MGPGGEVGDTLITVVVDCGREERRGGTKEKLKLLVSGTLSGLTNMEKLNDLCLFVIAIKSYHIRN